MILQEQSLSWTHNCKPTFVPPHIFCPLQLHPGYTLYLSQKKKREFLVIRKPYPSCSHRGTEECGIWFPARHKCSLAAGEREPAAVGRRNGKAALEVGAPSLGSSCYLAFPVIILGSCLHDSCHRPSEPSCQACTEGRVDIPVSRRPGDPTARSWHQHSVPFLGKPHPLLHKPGFPFHNVLSSLCGTKWGEEYQEGRSVISTFQKDDYLVISTHGLHICYVTKDLRLRSSSLSTHMGLERLWH